MKNLLLITLCALAPSIASANNGADLLNPDFVKKFLPPEYHNRIAPTIGALQSAMGGSGASAPVPSSPGVLGGISSQINTQTPLSSISMPPGPLQYTPPNVSTMPAQTGGSFNPYMPSSAPVQTAPVSTGIPTSFPSTAIPNTTVPVAMTGNAVGPTNPFTNPRPVQVSQPSTNLVLKADLNANPVFHPPLESTVPQYPPIEGQHWYQYVVADGSLNPLA